MNTSLQWGDLDSESGPRSPNSSTPPSSAGAAHSPLTHLYFPCRLSLPHAPDSAGGIRETEAFTGAQTLWVTQDSLSLSSSLPAWWWGWGDWALKIPTSSETPPPPPLPGSPAATCLHSLPGSSCAPRAGRGQSPPPPLGLPRPARRSPPLLR